MARLAQIAPVDSIMRYESGEMNQDEMVEFFQELIDSGLAWQLQGHYGRTAANLIDAGYCQRTPQTELNVRDRP